MMLKLQACLCFTASVVDPAGQLVVGQQVLSKRIDMAATKIEWCTDVWNPVRGCTKISPGCAHCYAETFSERFRGVKDHPYEQGFDLRLVPEKLTVPLKWKRPRMIFVNSMSDLFHEDVPDSYIDKVFAVMKLCPQHTFQILTKRSDRMRAYVTDGIRNGRGEHTDMYITRAIYEIAEGRGCTSEFLDSVVGVDNGWPKNAWAGTSVENKKHGLPRIEHLRQTPAAVRFLSIEPLLEDLGVIDLTGIGWVIVGGESGHGARPMEADWATSIRDQCVSAGVPFFFKQWGGVRKKIAGRELEGKLWDEMPKVPEMKL